MSAKDPVKGDPRLASTMLSTGRGDDNMGGGDDMSVQIPDSDVRDFYYLVKR